MTRRWRWPVVALLYGVVAVGMTHPLALEGHRRIPGYGEDVWIFLWNNWWLRTALATGRNPFHTPYLFFPDGASLVTHSNSFVFSAISAALHPLAGDFLAYNLSLLAIFVVAAVGACLLAYELTGHRAASFVTGVAYAFAPYYVTQALVHPNLASVEWLPFLALFLVRLARTGEPRNGVYAGGAFALTVWSDLHLAVLAGVWAGAFLVWNGAAARLGHGLRILRGLAVFAAIAAVLSTPAVFPVAKALAGGGLGGVYRQDGLAGRTDLLAYVVPPRLHPAFGPAVRPVVERLGPNEKWSPYLGIVPLGLAVYASVVRPRAAAFWWSSGLLWIVLALGDSLRVNGADVLPEVPLPWALVGHGLPLNALRSSDRMNLLVPLSLSVLVALGLSRLGRPIWSGLALVAISFEYLCAPVPMRDPVAVSPFVHRLREEPGWFAVLDVPMGRYHSKPWMYLQTVHEKPIADGHLSRVPRGTRRFLRSIPLVSALQRSARPAPADLADGMKRLHESGIRYLLIHRRAVPPRTIGKWPRWLGRAPVHSDEHLLVFETGAAGASPARAAAGSSPGGKGASAPLAP